MSKTCTLTTALVLVCLGPMFGTPPLNAQSVSEMASEAESIHNKLLGPESQFKITVNRYKTEDIVTSK